MDEHRRFLADRLLSDEEPITYRILSRALDVHVNTAKEMLYDFHKHQNEIKADSVHATYVLYGQRKPLPTGADGDVDMENSQAESDVPADEVATSTLTLVREEELKDVMAEYDALSSIHVYSLSPYPKIDYTQIVNLTKTMSKDLKEDRLLTAQKYGVITNPNVRRRERKGRFPPAAATSTNAAKAAPSVPSGVKKEPTLPAKPTAAAKIKSEDSDSKTSTPTSSAGKKAVAPPLSRGGSGGIMQSFAKAASKPAKPKPAAKKEEDTAMALSDDGEADDADLPPSKKQTAEQADSLKKAKQDREAALRKMMEEDDEDDDDEEKEEETEEKDEEMDDAPEPDPEPVKEEKASEPTEVVASTGDGRRRGKRRVMQKKRILDDQGYMVTIQEAAWESFSEDEEQLPAKKQMATPAPATAKAKKSMAKPGQGNIMSFFGKK